MCRDFLRLGYSRMVVDPGVRLAYTADIARQRYTQKVPGSALILTRAFHPRQAERMATCKCRPAALLPSSVQSRRQPQALLRHSKRYLQLL